MYTGIKSGVFVLALSLLGFSQSMFALDISPHIGTWAIDEEVNGKPGRGFQIDVQNDILVLYFYGYEETGESTFWLAAGKIPVGSNEVTADLGAYEGGMAFGDPIKNAVYLGSRGQVTIRFEGFRWGEICLPNEACKAISAFNFGFENSASELLGTWLVHTVKHSTGANNGLTVTFNDVYDPPDPGVIDRADGYTTLSNDDGTQVSANVSCEKLVEPGENGYAYSCTIVTDDEVRRFAMSTSRNAFMGKYYHVSDSAYEGSIFGYRLKTGAGRLVLPD